MTSGSDPRGRPGAYRAQPAPGGGGIFSGPNLPFTLVIFVCVAALVWFIILVQPFSETGASGPTVTTPTTPGNGDTTPTEPGTGPGTEPTNGPGTAPPAGECAQPISYSQPAMPDSPLQGIRLEVVSHDVRFPVYATGLPGDDRIFVLERAGMVRAVSPDGSVATFLDLTDRVDSAGIENGLLGMAFHPEYATNGRIFIYYTTAPSDSPDSRLSEFRSTGAGAATADRTSEQILIEVQQRGIRHRGGMIQFGPDCLLYLALGDGGMGDRSSQETGTLQGNILRIDVDRQDPGLPYGIPSDNPFVGADGRDEIWAYGLRNPWRFSIDPVDGLIYIGDVGQANIEEINVSPANVGGLDYGWPNFEGTNCYQPSDGCSMDPGVVPVLEIRHDDTDKGCSVTAGFVYRGTAMPELWGHFFYGDWCNGWMRSFKYANGQVTDHRDWSADMQASFDQIPEVNFIHVGSFGLDANGELLLVDTDGTIFRIVPRR